MKKIQFGFVVLAALVLFGFGLMISGCDSIVGPSDTTTLAPVTTSTAAPTTTAGGTTTTTSGGTTTTTTSTTTTTLPSISGQVLFHTSSAGVKGGVDISLTQTGTLIAAATADAVNGTYTLLDIPAGTYTIVASKDGWTIPSLTATVAAAALTNQNFTAEVTNWDVKNLGGLPGNVGANANLVSSIILTGNGKIYIVGGDGSNSVILYSGLPVTGETWTAASGNPTSESLVGVGLFTPTSLGICDRLGNLFFGTAETSVWNFSKNVSTEPISFYATNAISGLTWETVTESGKVVLTSKAAAYDITPSGVNPIKALYTNVNIGYVAGSNGALRKSAGSIITNPAAIIWNSQGNIVTSDDLSAFAIFGSASIVGSNQGSIWTSSDTAATYSMEASGIPYSILGSRIPTLNSLTGAYVFGSNGLIMKRNK